MDKLAEQALHVALTSWKQTLQEGDVSAMSCQQQSNVGQGLDHGHWEGYKEKHSNLG